MDDDDKCPTCGGSGGWLTKCPVCGGSGRDMDSTDLDGDECQRTATELYREVGDSGA